MMSAFISFIFATCLYTLVTCSDDIGIVQENEQQRNGPRQNEKQRNGRQDEQQRNGRHMTNYNSARSNQHAEDRYSNSKPGRLAEAVRITAELRRSNSYEILKCPEPQKIGFRPGDHTEDISGTTCEGWINRNIIMVLNHFLSSEFVGMEWSTGSGTLWLLRRLKKLYSVEHELPWLKQVQTVVNKTTPWLASKWISKHSEFPLHSEKHPHSLERIQSAYVKILEHEFRRMEDLPFDFIQVDGRERSACLAQALLPDMLKYNGILLLDNADRPDYNVSIVPGDFLTVSFQEGTELETALFMSCSMLDTNCIRAKNEIHESLQSVASHVGSRYVERIGKL
jgi:hypothetical protein